MTKGDRHSQDSGHDEVRNNGKPLPLSTDESDNAQAGRWAIALAGDDENAAVATFTQIYNRYWRPLVAFGARYCNLTAQDAKDLAQDLFAHIWLIRRTWSVHTSVFRYLLRAMENRALNRYRNEDRRAARDHAIMNTVDLLVDNDGEYAIEERELSAAVVEILKHMPPRQQDVLRMRRLEGLSMREIEAALSLSENTVRRALKSAIVRLHREWRDRGWDHLALHRSGSDIAQKMTTSYIVGTKKRDAEAPGTNDRSSQIEMVGRVL
ncbi:MAG TPA: sigma-70 family RNA polymerase sigma factor [Gemmatimonadaceae bacterium]|jgi:RNA polymerase sigma factor (sigma-70 family)|nr:sigma-70 family RNA polymerase sigma factor [Gemmatimonadaceae bacterium]